MENPRSTVALYWSVYLVIIMPISWASFTDLGSFIFSHSALWVNVFQIQRTLQEEETKWKRTPGILRLRRRCHQLWRGDEPGVVWSWPRKHKNSVVANFGHGVDTGEVHHPSSFFHYNRVYNALRNDDVKAVESYLSSGGDPNVLVGLRFFLLPLTVS